MNNYCQTAVPASDSAPHGNRADYSLYDRTARTYDHERFAGRAGQWGHSRQISILKDLAQSWQGKKVLEIGCGTGRITEQLVRWGAIVTATDISLEMIDVSRERFNGQAQLAPPEFRTMSVFDIDIDLGGFDYIVMVNVLGRLTNAGDAVAQIASQMSHSCRLVFTFPSLTSVLLPFGLLVNLRNKSLGRDVTSHWYRPDTIVQLCHDAGLEVTSWHGNHYVPRSGRLAVTLPLFQACDSLLAKRFPRRCPSVFVECRRI